VAIRGITIATALLLGVAACAPPETNADTSAVLVFDTEKCRNSGTVRALGVVWELVDAVPVAWQESGERKGRLRAIDGGALFTADDGTKLKVTDGPHEEECVGWPDTGG
jgi:hypothetical protein